MQLLEQARAWLAAINPALPAVVLVFIIWAPQAAIRRWLPRLWEVPASWGPKAKELRRIWQALPSLAGGALVTALASKMDPWAAVTGALLGAVAPFWHHTLKAIPFIPYQGELGGKRATTTPPLLPVLLGVFGMVIAAASSLATSGCSSTPPALDSADAAAIVKKAFEACELYPRLPAELQNDESTKACEAMKRAKTICTDVIAPAAPAAEPPPTDAGPGDDDTREKPADGDVGVP
jgi:hypothetical protein